MANDLEKALKYIGELEERNRVLQLELQATKKLSGDGVVMITSLVSHRNQRPRVDIQVGEVHTQMDAEHAVDVGRNMIEVAMGAYADAFLTNFIQDKLGQELNVAAQILVDFREYREKLAIKLKEEV
jgi:hypothetical protein